MLNKRILTPYEKNQLLKYGIDIKKLLNTDAPVEYVTGHVDFLGLNLLVSPDVLIPRVETEELVKMAVEQVENTQILNKTFQIVDVGTGSGAIVISITKKLSQNFAKKSRFEVTGLDISKDALMIAEKNLSKINREIKIDGEKSVNIRLPIKFAQSDLLSQWDSTKKIDLIVANLPYIPSDRIEKLDNSVKDFEPHLALDGGPDGLNLVRKLLKQAENMISKNGVILLELDITHTQEKMKEFEDEWKIEIVESKLGGVNFGVLSLIKLIDKVNT